MSMATTPRTSAGAVRFDRAEVLILDHHAANGESLRSYLRMLGMQKIKLVTNIADASAAARENSWDLLLADITNQANEICMLVRALREGRITANPFLHIILLAWRLENDVVRQSATCGADEFVTRPFSINFLEARIKAIMTNRPDFVVTGDYIGPDRRRDKGRQTSATTFAAPNSLKVKCQQDFGLHQAGSALRTHIQSTCSMLNAERIQKSALQMSVLVSLLKDAFTAMDPLEPGLKELHATASDLIDRARNSGAHSVLADAEPILEAIVGAQMGINVAAHIETIGRLSADLFLVLNESATREGLQHEIARVRGSLKSARARG